MQDEVMALFHELADTPPSVREEYYASRRIPASIRDEVESLLRFDTESTPFRGAIAAMADEALHPSDEPAEFGPYRVIRPLGRGGMGQVYLAERADGEVEHRVAIKVARWGAGLPGFRERFLRERSILASLSHPGIARLFDAGHTTSGQPYLVMEYIDGATIDEHCSSLDLRSVLKLFLLVCEAVSYAHRNLVIHRDLKPSNILVDSSGRPKLLDFGIAKILEDGDPSRTVIRILTPEYASPEQMRGEAHSTATDIYSLGAVLYELLTGRAPTSAESDRELVPPPSSVRPNIPRDVDSIVEKSLRAEPDERYGSVDAFADDIRAFLDNRPVRARAGGGWYRARKFLRRYWVPATAAAVAVVALSAGLYVADRERAIAERRFVEVRQLANKVFDIDAAIRNTPGTTKARQLIVATSLQYLEKVGAEAHGDRDLALEIGSAYVHLAHVQGVPVNANLGQFAAAEDSLRKADAFVESVLAVAPANRRALLLSATIAHDRMALSGVQGHRDEAAARALESAGKLARLMGAGKLDENEVKETAFMYSNVAVTFDENRNYEEAIRYARRSIQTGELIKESAGQRSLAYGILADALRATGDLDAALAAIRESRRLQEQFAGNRQMWQQANLALAIWREGSILGEDGDVNLDRPKEAVAMLQQALNIADELAAKDRDETIHHQLAAEIGRRIGDILRHSEPQAALAAYDHGILLVSEAGTANVSTRRTRAALLAGSSYPLRSMHRTAESTRRIDEAIQLLRQAGDYPAERIEPGSEVDLALRALADRYAESGESAKAVATYQELLTKLKASGAAPERDLRSATYFAGAYAGLEHAGVNGGERLRIWQEWNRRLPNNPFIQRQLASVRVN